MTKLIEDKLLKIPILNILVKLTQKIKIPGLEGMSLYDIIEMYVLGIVKGALTSRAGGIAFSFFMALFPFLLFILTLIPYVPIDGFQQDFLNTLQNLLPPNTAGSVNEVITDIANNRYGGLLSFGFVASIFLMTNGVNAVFGGFEYSYHIKDTEMRSVLKQYFMAMGMSIVLALILLLVIAINVYFQIILDNLKSNGWLTDDIFWMEASRVLFFVILIFVSVSFLYKYGTKEVKQVSYMPGAILTTLLSLLMFKLFAVYVTRFSNYNELYGSIGTLLVLMLFVWLNSIILLLGFELNASINRVKKKSLRRSALD